MAGKLAALIVVLGLALATIGCGSGQTPTAASSAAVQFSDPNLEAAVREAIGKSEGNLTEADLTTLTSLDASDKDVASLGGLEHCKNLIILKLNLDSVSDLILVPG